MIVTSRAPSLCDRRVSGAKMPPYPGTSACLRTQLRDGLLQDLLAVGMLVRAAREGLVEAPDDAAALLAAANQAIDLNLAQVRELIDRLAVGDEAA